MAVVTGQFQNLGAPDPPHSDRVIEIDRSRVAGIDLSRLGAGLREYQRLRLERDFQRTKDRSQVSARRIERELNRSLLNLLVEIANRIVDRRSRIGDRRMIPR